MYNKNGGYNNKLSATHYIETSDHASLLFWLIEGSQVTSRDWIRSESSSDVTGSRNSVHCRLALNLGKSQQRKRRVPSRQTCIAQNIQSRGDLSVLLPVFPQRGKLNKNARDDTAATRLRISTEMRSNCLDHEAEYGSYHTGSVGSIKWDIVDKVLWYQYLHCGVIDIRLEWSIAPCQPARMGLPISVGLRTDTRDIYDVGCLIDHHRPNQVNFYTRIRLVLVGFCHPAIPQSIEEDKALGTEKSSTQPVTTSTRLSSDKFVPNSRRQSGSGKAVLSPGLPSHWSSDDIKNAFIIARHSLTEIRKFSANIFVQLDCPSANSFCQILNNFCFLFCNYHLSQRSGRAGQTGVIVDWVIKISAAAPHSMI